MNALKEASKFIYDLVSLHFMHINPHLLDYRHLAPTAETLLFHDEKLIIKNNL